MADFRFSLAAQIAEVEAEIRKRRDVYDRLVRVGKMSPSQASYKIAAMEAVRDTLREQALAASSRNE